MLAAHLLDENRRKSLKELAHMELGVPNWAIETKDLLSQPIMEILEYNALDTWYTFWLYRKFRTQLNEQPRLRRIFQRIYMPAANEITDIQRRGVWLHCERRVTRHQEARRNLAALDAKTTEYAPDAQQSRNNRATGALTATGRTDEHSVG